MRYPFSMDLPRLPTGRPLREQAHEVLEDLIIHRTLPPGAHLAEEELARQLGVSRIPVREALHVLERDGWVERRHRQGAFVARPDADWAEQTFEVRRILESQTAALAAARISSEELVQLEEILEAGKRAVEAGNREAVVDLNTRLHRAVAAASHNQVLIELLRQLEKRVVWYFSAVATIRSHESWREHEELVAALRSRDVEEASRLMTRHTEATRLAYRDSARRQPQAASS